jgi:two-component system OmpR family response regulator
VKRDTAGSLCDDAPVSAPPTRRRVLVVDDDDSIRELVKTALTFVGFEVAEASDGLQALNVAPQFAADLVVLDVNMPGFDGFEVCRRMRADGDTTPVVFLTAKDTSQDMLDGFATGGDDYLTKPFNLQVLVARIEAVLRRTAPASITNERVSYADLELDDRAHRVWRHGELVGLSPTEFKLLRYLLLNAEQVLSKAQIAEHIWQYDFGGDANIVETHMSYLRRKLGEPRLIQTVRGVGYVLRTEP